MKHIEVTVNIHLKVVAEFTHTATTCSYVKWKLHRAPLLNYTLGVVVQQRALWNINMTQGISIWR